MPDLTITLSANAGVSLVMNGTGILIDAYHDRKVSGYSTVSESMYTQMQSHPGFAHPDIIAYTHCHRDHFSYLMNACALERHKPKAFLLPEELYDTQQLLSGDSAEYDVGDIHITAIKLTHAGGQFYNVPHYGYLITWKGKTILFPGDCSVAAPELLPFLEQAGHIDLALLNFPWCTLIKGRTFIEKTFDPHMSVSCTCPFRRMMCTAICAERKRLFPC